MNQSRARRIVVVFGGGGSDTGVAGVLASLASEGAANIAAVFLEDQTLFRLAELPFTTELCRMTTARRPLTVTGLERQMRVQAARAEQAVRRIAERAGSSWSFRTHRGPLGRALADSRDVDVLLIGARRRSLAPSGELLATARAVRSDEVERQRPVAVLLERADTAAGSLDAGIRLSVATGQRLVVFLSEEVADAHPGLMRRLEALGTKRWAAQRFSSSNRQSLFVDLRRAAPAVLIVSAGDVDAEESRIGTLQSQLSCPVLVMRTTSPIIRPV